MALSKFFAAGIGALGLLSVCASAAKRPRVEGPPPSFRIPTDEFGYHPLSSFYLMGRTSSSSLDFIDDDHLLFTFRATGLLKRLSECQPDDEDQLIRALVIHLPDGKVERSAEWRMHDRGRYLWPLRDGHFLVRRRDALFMTDATLELQPYLDSREPIKLVKLSPDARMLMIETDLEKHSEEEHRRLVAEALEAGAPMPGEDVQMMVVRTEDRELLAKGRFLAPRDISMLAGGYVETLAGKGDHWMLRYQPFDGKPSMMTEVASACQPNEIPLNENALFVSTCDEKSDDRLLRAVTVSGRSLWTYRWDNRYVWPTEATSENGRRMAFSTLRVARPVSALDPIDDDDLQAQRIEVLDAETGKLELTQFAIPMLSGGQNYALSHGGDRFAVLSEGAIEVYVLPALPPQTGSGD